jgi:hypothetical protein
VGVRVRRLEVQVPELAVVVGGHLVGVPARGRGEPAVGGGGPWPDVPDPPKLGPENDPPKPEPGAGCACPP